MRRGLIALYILMLSLAAINYADRVVLSIAVPTIATEFHVSTVTLGYFLSCFLWTYAACLILWGFAVDRFGPRAVTAIGLTIWSLATVTTGFCTSLPMLFASRLVMGGGEASWSPSTGRLVREWVPVAQRALSHMIVSTGSYAGPALGSVLFAWVASRYGWRAGFFVMGGLGSVWLVAWAIWFRRPDGAPAEPVDYTEANAAAAAGPIPSGGLSRLVRSVSMWGLFFTQGTGVYTHYLFLTWLPSYLVATRHLTIMKTGLLSAVPYGGTIVAGLLLAHYSDRSLRTRGTHTGERRRMVAAMLILSAVVLATPFADSTWLVLLLISVSMTGSAVANALNASLLLDLLDSSDDAGKATGLLVTGGNVFGLLAPIVTSYVIAGTGSYGGAFIVAGGLLIAGAVVVLSMTRRPIITRATGAPVAGVLAAN
jgi:ACS family glucarate transporter-like MFS transporter